MFQITNKSAHLFTAEEITKIRDYVTHRVLDEIICAEITETEVVCTTLYGLRSSNLSEIFSPATPTCATCRDTGVIPFESHGGNGSGVTNCPVCK